MREGFYAALPGLGGITNETQGFTPACRSLRPAAGRQAVLVPYALPELSVMPSYRRSGQRAREIFCFIYGFLSAAVIVGRGQLATSVIFFRHGFPGGVVWRASPPCDIRRFHESEVFSPGRAVYISAGCQACEKMRRIAKPWKGDILSEARIVQSTRAVKRDVDPAARGRFADDYLLERSLWLA
jgi:hypothetical protein